MTDRIIELYKKISDELEGINSKIAKAEDGIVDIKAAGFADIPARIEHLEEVLEKIDEYVLKVKGFQELAKKNLESQNVLTIEAPPGYRVNLNRLKNWSMLIDPQSDNDPYAQRVLTVAKCDECFLEQKRAEFTQLIKDLKNDHITGLSEEMSHLEDEIIKLEKKRNEIVSGELVEEFVEALVEAQNDNHYKYPPKQYKNADEFPQTLCYGSIAEPFAFGDKAKTVLSRELGDLYLADEGKVLLPYRTSFAREIVMTIACSPNRSRQLDKAMQNIVLRQIDESPVGTRKVYVLDAARFNSSSVGSLRKLEGSFALEQIPRNQEQLTATLEQIVSSFGDIDEIIEMFDSVREYNESEESENIIPYNTLVIMGWPNSFSQRDRELIGRILSNYERYGITPIIISYCINQQDIETKAKDIPEYATYNAIRIEMIKNNSEIRLPGFEEPKIYSWNFFDGELPDSYVGSLRQNSVANKSKGNEYTELYDMSSIPAYTRELKPIVMPFGIDGKDQEHYISFDKNNFAAYLIGQSGSGKSTLIHTIIAGILRNQHPDSVELWLADFKQVEFKQYITHTPPHVKYILLYESNELVYDLIDKLNDEMLFRQQLLAKLDKEKIEEVDVEKELGKPLPYIFVILDEFSIMSQAIDEDQSYKLKLQNLLAKGRALGFKFLFASQKFTSGISGLTATARDQIQQRIAMKQSKDEINEVLELSPNLRTEKVTNWIESIPPYYALIKQRVDDDTLEVSRVKVMYFGDNYVSRDKLIDDISSKMVCSEIYNHSDINSYLDKKPVFVDGNSYSKYTMEEFEADLSDTNHDKDELLLSLGVPRLMTRIKPVILSEESRENMLIIARNSEQECAASILYSIIQQSKKQQFRVCVWAYGKNRLFKRYKDVFVKENVEIFEGGNAICGEIKKEINRIRQKQSENKIIILLGMDRICVDFEYMDSSASINMPNAISASAVVRYNASEISIEDEMRSELQKRIAPIKKELREKGRIEGKTKEEINEQIAVMRKKIAEEIQNEFGKRIIKEDQATIAMETHKANDGITNNDIDNDVYNATDDFIQFVKQASRYGTHIVNVLNSLSDLKNMNIRQDEFRYKMSFQLSVDDSRTLFSNRKASELSEHVCMYDDSMERYSFRPYIYKDINWDGWYISENGELISPFGEVQ